jgi:hypothetical protein
MKVIIEDVVMQFKHDIRRCLSAEFIVTVCQTLGYVWRDRQLGPVAAGTSPASVTSARSTSPTTLTGTELGQPRGRRAGSRPACSRAQPGGAPTPSRV